MLAVSKNNEIPATVWRSVEKALSGGDLSRDELIELLSLREDSLAAALVMASANAMSRERFAGEAMLLGQIGVEVFPCPANCLFCVFGEKHTVFPTTSMPDETILAHAENMTRNGSLYALFIMCMHTCDFARLLDIMSMLERKYGGKVKLVVNMGDFDLARARELKAAGVTGAYHVRRLREGVDTSLAPGDREATIRAIKEAGLEWYYCCEPIGPEHTAAELADQILLGREYSCFQHAAMRRVAIPGGPLSHYGQITELRLALVVAVVALAMAGNRELAAIAVHEPSLIGLVSGANSVYAESGANPRDSSENTEEGRGADVAVCARMFWEAGFSKFMSPFSTRAMPIPGA